MADWNLIVVAAVSGGCALAGAAIGPLITQYFKKRDWATADNGRHTANLRTECTAAMDFATGYMASLATGGPYIQAPDYTFEAGVRQFERLAVILERTRGALIHALISDEMKLMQRAEELSQELAQEDARYLGSQIERLQQPGLTADEMKAILSEPIAPRLARASELQTDFTKNHVRIYRQMDELGWRV